jgi:3-hydroxyacyl-CoA dehydrogenase/enoyl-CoA hydratase/3-hydroxybutyryl-CoA epimerase
MVRRGRPGRFAAAGFYEYDNGRRAGLWADLAVVYPPVADPASVSLRDCLERMLFIESLETVRCFDEGVIASVADANVGSILGIGFPGWTGGVLQYINGYEGSVSGFVARARELAARYGDRFEPPTSLVAKAEGREQYSDDLLVSAS